MSQRSPSQPDRAVGTLFDGGPPFDLLQKAANDARDGLIVSDVHGNIIHVNPVAVELFGYEPDELMGRNISLLIPEARRREHDGYMESYVRTGKSGILGIGPRDLVARRKDGSQIPIELSITEFVRDGRRSFVGICRNITERKARERALVSARETLSEKLEELQRVNAELSRRQEEIGTLVKNLEKARDEAQFANSAKTDFLAMMSHEIRTPLNGVIGMAQLLAQTELDVGQRGLLDVISCSSASLLALLNDLLDLSKIEAGEMTLELRTIDLREFLSSIANRWRPRIEAKGLRFSSDLSAELERAAELDSTRLQQILDNLIDNALKFTKTGQISFEAQILRESHSQRLRLKISDTGIGIAGKDYAAIFEPFHQADSSVTRRYGGTGLGLSICRKLIERMGGSISVDSILGAGSSFSIVIPMRLKQDAKGAAPVAAEASASSSKAPLSILVVEDGDINQRVIRAILQNLGHREVTAANGKEALKKIEEDKFDVVLMDLHMPEMDGLAATRHIRARNDALADIPIIGLTASAFDSDRQACLSAGMNDFVTKPILIKNLVAALDKIARPPIKAKRVASGGN